MLGHQRVHEAVPVAAPDAHFQQVNSFFDQLSEVTAKMCDCSGDPKGRDNGDGEGVGTLNVKQEVSL